eukprot:TRINITY_DN73770_c0_g1_i1.p1 TRINITY_DN73770_c0_g1~~TRINITY_DN73770_c0_g1_i1.p1  ORF type:complete len:187 (-),score=37.29 TRINITY_DN73770_c0_g1_i1:91-651(-)
MTEEQPPEQLEKQQPEQLKMQPPQQLEKPLPHWRTLLVLDRECEAWKEATSKWLSMDDEVRGRRLMRTASAPSAVKPMRVSGKLQLPYPARKNNFKGARSTYGNDFPFFSPEQMALARPALSRLAGQATAKTPKAVSVLRRENGEVLWQTLVDPTVETRKTARHFGGGLRPYPHISMLADRAAKCL